MHDVLRKLTRVTNAIMFTNSHISYIPSHPVPLFKVYNLIKFKDLLLKPASKSGVASLIPWKHYIIFTFKTDIKDTPSKHFMFIRKSPV